jgi:radical SAM superfamily enzyme YgiQ (UPF0313 family)
MVNASFVFGLDDDDDAVVDHTVEWAVEQGVETSTFHILTPYPGTALYDRMLREERIVTSDWELYDTRHVVYRPARMTADALSAGYWHAYEEFYNWKNIFQAAGTHTTRTEQLRHLAYAGGWKKFEPLWDFVIRVKKVANFLPVLETILAGSEIQASMTKTSAISYGTDLTL